jgi:hypothetical protein
VVSDGSGEQFFVGDLTTGKIEQTFDLNELHYDDCDAGDDEKWCMTFQTRHRLDHLGRREIVYAYNPVAQRGAGGDVEDDTTILGVALEGGEERWRVDALDFSQGFDGSQFCWWDDNDPCRPHPDGDEINNRTCRLYEAHDMVVVDQDDAGLTMWVADSKNARMLKVHATYDSTCAVVEEVVNAALVDWDIYITPNSMQWWVEDGEEHLLATMKSSWDVADFTQEGGDGRGKIVEFAKRDGFWRQLWEFPPESAIEPSFVNAPHGVARTVTDSGEEYVVFAHSLALSDEFDRGEGGTFTVLRIEEESPVYLFDAVLPDLSMGFTRDINPLDDGLFMGVDSGCISGLDCDRPTGLYVLDFDLDNQPPSELSGMWTPDNDQIDDRVVEVMAGPFFGNADMIYSVELVP